MNSSVEDLVGRIQAGGAGQYRAAAKLMSLFESQPERAVEFHIRRCGSSQTELVLGITGPPGSGKSTLTDGLISEFRRRSPAERIGVIAVDPSSHCSGGAVLGDRVRMMKHATDDHVFIRSLASRGRLGGLTAGVHGVLSVMEWIGCRIVIVETVGVGQNEIEVSRVADVVGLVFSPGQGDGVQMLKAGLMEIGDVLVVNKADLTGADVLARELVAWMRLRFMTRLETSEEEGIAERDSTDAADHALGGNVFLVSATEGTGVKELVDRLDEMTREKHDDWMVKREESMRRRVKEAIVEAACRRVSAATGNGLADELTKKVLGGACSMDEAVDVIIRHAGGSAE